MASFFQFSIRSLLVAVTFVAVGLAALLNANAWWEAAVWGGVLFVLSCAVALIIFRRSDGRSYWIGFGIFGWLYLFVLVHSWTPHANPQETRSDPLAQASLITTRLSRLAYDSLMPASRTQSTIGVNSSAGIAGSYYLTLGTANDGKAMAIDVAQMLMASNSSSANSQGGLTTSVRLIAAGTSTPNPNYVPVENFIHVAHALWLLVIAAVGGAACQIIYRTRPADPQVLVTRSVSEGCLEGPQHAPTRSAGEGPDGLSSASASGS